MLTWAVGVKPAAMNCSCLLQGYAEGRYILPPLPYPDSAIEPLLSAEALYLHHDKHHAAYVVGANAALDALRLINNGELSPQQAPSVSQNLAFNLGGHILHTLYWENICPTERHEPTGDLALAILRDFGSYAAFEQLFLTVSLAVQGSGWGVLGLDPMSHRLMVTGIRRHQDVLVPGFCPLLVCDVWEHAYYLNWRNDRKGYLYSFMQHINWNIVEQRYEKARCYE